MSDPATIFSGSDDDPVRPHVEAAPAPSPGSEQVHPAQGYSGDISPAVAWQWAQAGTGVIVDVRSDAERAWVGTVPGAVALAWKQWPRMTPNPEFDAGLQQFDNSRPLLMLCRSGVRSIAAARRAEELGLQAYNILEGFEGEPDGDRHRGNLGGWRYCGLPWQQE